MSIIFFSLLFSQVLIFAPQVSAKPDLWGGDGNKDKVKEELGYTEQTEDDPRIVAASIIKVLMTFLGIISVGIVLWGGYKWMTAAGNEDQVSESKKIITSGIIGLLIILAAWAIASWTIDTIDNEILKKQ